MNEKKCKINKAPRYRTLKPGRHSCVSRDLISPAPKMGGVDYYRPSGPWAQKQRLIAEQNENNYK